MDQEKIGQFIAACRKEQGLTQVQLAEKLGITNRAVSKWETAKSMPDVSVMVPLCEILHITVNELLSGEKLTMDEYKDKAERNLVEMKQKQGMADRALKRISMIWLVVSVLGFIFHMVMNYYEIETGGIEGIVVLLIGLVIFIEYFYRYYEIRLK